MSTPTAERPRLRELRLEQGWTQQDVADRMARLAWSRQEKPIGVTADMVAKWERGAKGVSPRYRALLASVFKVTIDQLGLPGHARGSTSGRRDENSLVALVDQTADLLQQLGDAGRAVRPQVLAALTDDVLSRRTVIDMLDEPASAAIPPSPEELDTLADQYESIHDTAAPAALMTAVTAHVRIVSDALNCQPSAGARQRLLHNRSRVAVLAGRLALKSGSSMVARAYLSMALDDASEMDDRRALVVAVDFIAQVAQLSGQPRAAQRYFDFAEICRK